MDLMGKITAAIDAAKRTTGKRISDLVQNPGKFLEQANDQAGNYNANVQPTIQGGELTNRQLTQEEIDQKSIDLAMAVMPMGVGSLKVIGPQTGALRLAQQRAALPVEKGGLGLPKNNTPQMRAEAMGAEFGWAHGSPNPDVSVIRSSKIGAEGRGAYATDYLPESSMYAGAKEGATVYPLAVMRGNTLESGAGSAAYDALKATTDDELAGALKAAGLDSITAKQPETLQWLVDAGAHHMPERRHYASENPDNFRSRFAAFDPWRKTAAIAATMGVAAPDLLAAENEQVIEAIKNRK